MIWNILRYIFVAFLILTVVGIISKIFNYIRILWEIRWIQFIPILIAYIIYILPLSIQWQFKAAIFSGVVITYKLLIKLYDDVLSKKISKAYNSYMMKFKPYRKYYVWKQRKQFIAVGIDYDKIIESSQYIQDNKLYSTDELYELVDKLVNH